jgi:hypothetical protein
VSIYSVFPPEKLAYADLRDIYILSLQIPFVLNTGTLRCESNMLTVDENTVLFNNGQNVLIQSKRFVQNP